MSTGDPPGSVDPTPPVPDPQVPPPATQATQPPDGDATEAQPAADASTAPPPPSVAPPAEAPPPQDRSEVPDPPDPAGHLARALGYEVWVILMTAVMVAVLAFVAFQGRFLDLYVKLRPHAPTSGEVVLLTIGAEALYLWNPEDPRPETTPRALLAEVVGFLDAAGARVVVLDFLLDTPREGDDALAAAAAKHGRVVAAERLEVNEPAGGRQFVAGVNPGLLGSVHGGFANFQVEQDTLFSGAMLVRRVPLVALADRSHLAGPWPMNQVGGRQDIDQVVPSLSLLAAALYRGDDDPAELARRLQAGCPDRPLDCHLGAEAFGLPSLPRPLAEPLPINFRGPEHADGIPVVDAARVLRIVGEAAILESLGVPTGISVPDDLRTLIEGRLVVVGRVDATADDRFTTAYSLPVPIEADMSGPRIHAQIVDTLLTGRQVRAVGGSPAWGTAALCVAGVLILRRRMRDAPLTALCLAVAVGMFVFAATLFAWTDGVALDLGPPLLGLLGALFAHLLAGWASEATESAR